MRTAGRGSRWFTALVTMALAATAIGVQPAGAVADDGDLTRDWTASVDAVEVNSVEQAPRNVMVVGDTVYVPAGGEVARFGRADGAPKSAWAAPAGVTITAVAAGPSGTLLAVGVKGADGWVGRFNSAGTVNWSDVLTGADAAELIGVAVVGDVAFVAGNAPGSFGREVFARRYSGIEGTPTAGWTYKGNSGVGDAVIDVAATSTAVYAVGSAFGPFGEATVWRFNASTGAVTSSAIGSGFLSARATGVAVDGSRVYVTYRGNSQTVIGSEVDGFVARINATTLATVWDEQIGTTYTPGTPPVLGSFDSAEDVIIDGAGVVVVGLDDRSHAAVDGFAGPGGFLARYRDNGNAGSRAFIVRTAPLRTAAVDGDGVLVVTQAPESYTSTSTGGACASAPGADCTLARLAPGGGGGPTTPPPHGFSDVAPGAFYDVPVAWLKAEGITTGTSPTTFSPGDPVTRGQMAAFLFRLEGEPAGSPAHGFSDVAAGAFYADAVAWLKAEGITTGTSPTTFSPGDPVTRGQMAAFLYRYATGG